MKYESMTAPPPEVNRIKLGQITHLPREYAANIEARDQDLPYEWFLEKSTSFTNPTGVEELTKELGLSFMAGKSSLFTGLMNGNYDPKTTASALRREQSGLMAFKHVALGIKYFKVWAILTLTTRHINPIPHHARLIRSLIGVPRCWLHESSLYCTYVFL